MDFLDKIQIEVVHADFFDACFAVSAPQLPGLIAANVKEGAFEVGEQFVVERVQKTQGSTIGFEGRAMFAPATQGVFESVGTFGQVVVGGMF